MKLGLVLEGGGMRGVFTAGVTDCFLDNQIYFPYVIGTSAGSSNGLSYVSRQRGRARFCNIDALTHRKYIGLKFLLTQKCIMDYNFLFDELPKKVYPYDFDTYLNSGTRFILVATNCNTGAPIYFDTPQTFDELLSSCRASCSLPFVCPIHFHNSTPTLDGGIADAIAIRKAISDGYKKCVVVLTRNAGYRKTEKFLGLQQIFYRKYPHLCEALKSKSERYNTALSFIEELETRGKIVVIRPEQPINVGRLNSDSSRLEALYNEGYQLAQKSLEKIAKLSASA